jgi:hypothetical protein
MNGEIRAPVIPVTIIERTVIGTSPSIIRATSIPIGAVTDLGTRERKNSRSKSKT